jgi:hypothetical protein
MSWLLAIPAGVALMLALAMLVGHRLHARAPVAPPPPPREPVTSILNGAGEQVDATVYPSRPPGGRP